MHANEKVVVELAPEIERLLVENGLDVVSLLKSEGLQLTRGSVDDIEREAKSREKEPATVLIASAAVIMSLTPILKKAIDRLGRKAVVVTEKVLEPVLDERGKLMYDKTGKPVTYWAERSRIVEESAARQERTKVTIKGPMKIEVKYESEPA